MRHDARHDTIHDNDQNIPDKPFIQVNFVNATELKPDSKYLIVLSQDQIDEVDAAKLVNSLGKMGINNAVALHVPGDPEQAVKIIEQKTQPQQPVTPPKGTPNA